HDLDRHSAPTRRSSDLGSKLEALSARLGWSGKPPITLEEAGSVVGISRERVRQLQKRTLDRLPQHPVFMPLLDAAIRLLRDKARSEEQRLNSSHDQISY